MLITQGETLILKLIGMGGTFDHLHEGHRFLIETALSLSHNVVIGLSTEPLLKNKKYPLKLEDYETRKKNLESFVSSFTDLNRVEILELNGPFDCERTPIDDPEFEGQIVSEETYPNALKINEIRESKGFKPMIIIVIPIIKGKNKEKISSTSIRELL